MYKVGVVVPSWHYFANPFKLQPYWELYYATLLQNGLRSSDASVDVVDLRSVQGDTLSSVVRKIPERNLYVYWVMKSGDAMEVYSIAKLLKTMYPSSIHVAGGTHVDMCTEECESYFDAVMVGPGERSLIDIVNDIHADQLKKRYGEDYREVPFRDTPFPKREFLQEDHVVNRELFEEYGRVRGTMLYFSRGCLYRCAFCVYNVPGFLQVRSPEMMRSELAYLKERYHIEGVLLKDEVCIHPDSKVSTEAFNALRESGLTWRGQTTTLATFDQLKMARESGCQELAVGVETVDENVMKIINKAWQTQRQVRSFVSNAKSVGIKVKMCLIFGLPGETNDVVKHTIRFLEETKPDYVNVSGFCPFPGSPMFKNPAYFGIKRIDRDWSKYAHLLYRFSDEEDVGLPFEYEERTRWGKSFTRSEIIGNIQELQDYLRSNGMSY